MEEDALSEGELCLTAAAARDGAAPASPNAAAAGGRAGAQLVDEVDARHVAPAVASLHIEQGVGCGAAAASVEAGEASRGQANEQLYSRSSEAYKGSAGAGAGVGHDGSSKKAQGGLKYSGGKLQVRVSAGSDSDDGSVRRTACGISRKALWCALTMLLLVVMAGVGVGVGVVFAKGKHTAAGAAKAQAAGASSASGSPAAAAMALFGLAARPTLPGLTSEQRCKLWFGTHEVSTHRAALNRLRVCVKRLISCYSIAVHSLSATCMNQWYTITLWQSCRQHTFPHFLTTTDVCTALYAVCIYAPCCGRGFNNISRSLQLHTLRPYHCPPAAYSSQACRVMVGRCSLPAPAAPAALQ